LPRPGEETLTPAGNLFTRLLAFVTGAICLATALSYLGRWSWFCELLVHFRTHFVLLSSLAMLVALVSRHWRIALGAAAALALNAWPLAGMYRAPEVPAIQDGRAVRVVAYNKHVGNSHLEAIARYLGSLQPDVVVLQETPAEHAHRLHELLSELGYFHHEETLGLGVAILSRWPLRDTQLVMRDGVVLAARADVDFGDRTLRLYGIHLHWPIVPKAAEYRNAELAALGPELAQCAAAGACVAVGDFNVTAWSSHYRDMVVASGFRDCARGRGWLPTWRTGLPSPLRIRIDHCLAGGPVGVADVRVGKAVGSDHFATINDLLLGRGKP
jgi:endonuclease/exonuclease/phosphatase (EEP) superfamily protein YafD